MAKVADKQQNIKFGGKAKKYIEKYAVKKYNKNNKQTNKRFNQKFADIYNELQNSPEKFYITTEINKMLMPEKSDGEFYYNGKEFFIIFKKHPTDKYGSKFGAMFEEIYHAKQFLDGKVWFENSGYGWELKGGNALIEYEAKKFATTAKKYGQTYSLTINDAVKLSAKTQLALIAEKNKKDGIIFLTQGCDFSVYHNLTDKIYYLHENAPYPEYLNKPTDILHRKNKQTTNSIYAYPYP